MTPEDEIRTARAVQYRGFMGSPIMTTQGDLENGTDQKIGTSNSTRRPELRKYDTTYPDIDLRDGRATYLSCLQRGYDLDNAQRVVDWERKHPVAINRLSATDRDLARDAKPWRRAPSPKWAPATDPLWRRVPPSPTPFSAEPPIKCPLPKSHYLGERLKARLPIRELNKSKSSSATGSPSRHSTREVSEDQCNIKEAEKMEAEKTDARRGPPVSYLTEEFLRDGIARNLAQADYLRDRREKREAEERKERRKKEVESEEAKREQSSNVEKKPKLEDVLIWLKDLARSWREKYSGSDKLFRKYFDFGPRAQSNRDDDYWRPLSPCSSGNSLPDLSSEVCSKPLKRQRHGSSNTDMARESPHNRSHATSSPIPIQRPQPTLSTSRSFSRGPETPEAHPGQRVDFTACASPDSEMSRSNGNCVRFLTSDYNRGDVVDYFRIGRYSPVENVREYCVSTRPQAIDRASCGESDLRHHLERVLSQQGKLKDIVEESQAALNEAFKIKTCKLQRRPRTTREYSPVLFEPVSRTRTAEPQVTKWSPVTYSLDRTKTTQTSAAEQDKRLKRRRSFVARCRSTDAFLRDVRESQRRRQLARETEYEGCSKQATPDPRFSEQELDWLGDDPL